MTTISVKGVPSNQKVQTVLQKGLMERGSLYLGAGLTAGALASIVLSKGATTRKVITAFGGGVGLGSAWTRTSMDLEDMLETPSSK